MLAYGKPYPCTLCQRCCKLGTVYIRWLTNAPWICYINSRTKIIPPEYCFLSGTRLNYPFLIDSLSSSLYMFGCPLRIAVLIPSFIFALCIVMGFYILSFSLTKSTTVSVIATLFFFLNGGFGFAYFFESAKEDPSNFTSSLRNTTRHRQTIMNTIYVGQMSFAIWLYHKEQQWLVGA